MKHVLKIMAMAAAVLAMAACGDKEEAPQPDVRATAGTPRSVAAAGGKVYVTCYNPPSVVRIDTATRKVEAVCRLGSYQPEGIAVAGGKLFVASSWIADETGSSLFDNKVYVVDLASFSVSATVEVGVNPQKVRAVDDSRVVVNYSGNYGDVPGGSAVIDVATCTARQVGREMTSMCTDGGTVYAYSSSYGAAPASYFTVDPVSMEVSPILEGCSVGSPYGIAAVGGDIYLTTGIYNANGDVYRLGLDGTERWRSEAGVFTSKVEPVGDGTAYVLNEGSWGSSNASLDRVDLASGRITRDVFATANGRGLGDIAQDVLVYGGKAWVTVSFSNTVEVVSVRDNRSSQIVLD